MPEPEWLNRPDPWIAEGMRGAAAIAEAEAAIAPGVVRAMGTYLDAVRYAVLGPDAKAITAASGEPTPDMSAWPEPGVWTALVDEFILPLIAGVWEATFAAVERAAQLSAADYIGTYLARVTDRLSPELWPRGVWREISWELAQGIEAEESIPQLRARVARTAQIDAPSRTIRARLAELTREIDAPATEPGRRKALRKKRTQTWRDLTEADRIWHHQAERVARTEAIGASNGGNFTAHLAWSTEAGETLYKRWWATRDGQTRASHRAAHGQTVPIGEPFTVGGSQMMFPGDPTGPPGEVIQCRCTHLVISRDDLSDNALTAGAAMPILTPVEWTILVDDTALTASAAPAEIPWQGPILIIGETTEDGRHFAPPADGTPVTRPMPLALNWQRESQPEHWGAQTVGRIDEVWIDGDQLVGRGVLDGLNPLAVDLARQIKSGFAGWVSVDLADLDVEETSDGALLYTYWKLDGATLLPGGQAIERARIGVVDEPAEAATPETVTASAAVLSEPFVPDPEALLSPPGRWFTADPAVFDGLEPSPHVIVEDSGRVYGYVGSRDTCHLAYPESCVTVPYSASAYGLFHHGPYVVTREGEHVRVGTITMGTNHAPDSYGFTASQAHYDDTGHAVASVRCVDTDKGVLIFGALKPGATREQVYELRARAISGDWRMVNGTQELSGVLAVNSGGFARVRRDGTSGAPTVLIASMRPHAAACSETTESDTNLPTPAASYEVDDPAETATRAVDDATPSWADQCAELAAEIECAAHAAQLEGTR